MTNYCGFNKCPDCGAIDLKEDGQKTRILCEICIKKRKQRANSVEESELIGQIKSKLEMIVTYLERATENLEPHGSANEAKLYIDDAQIELERIFKLL